LSAQKGRAAGFIDDVVVVVEDGAPECELRDTKPPGAYRKFRALMFEISIWTTEGKRQLDEIDLK
jgi:hypothetical protein